MTVLKVSFLQALGQGDPLIFLASEVPNQKMHIGSGTAMKKSDDLCSFHSYNKNGYVSSFFREGKKACWKIPKAPKSSFYLCRAWFQGRQELFEAQGQHCQLRPPASGGSRKFFQSFPLDWLKMHFRTFPAVKMSKSFNYEAP